MQYRESLPPDCPPPSAQGIMDRTVRYRLLETTSPKQEDFDSYVKRQGGVNRRIRRTPCEQSGVSLLVSQGFARKLMTSYFNRNRRWQAVGELTLPSGAGKFNPADSNGHQTWWPSQAFDPVGNCTVLP